MELIHSFLRGGWAVDRALRKAPERRRSNLGALHAVVRAISVGRGSDSSRRIVTWRMPPLAYRVLAA